MIFELFVCCIEYTQSESFSYSAEEAAKYGMHFDPNVHGNDGPLKKTFPVYVDSIAKPSAETANALGIPTNPDPVRVLELGSIQRLNSTLDRVLGTTLVSSLPRRL